MKTDENDLYMYSLTSYGGDVRGNCHNFGHNRVTSYPKVHTIRVTSPPASIMQEPSLRIVPPAEQNFASLNAKANSFGLHDTLQYGPRSIAAETKSRDDIEKRLSRVSTCFARPASCHPMESTQWEETQDNLKLTMLRNLHGAHAPARLLMERKIVAAVSSRDRSAIEARRVCRIHICRA